MLPSVWVLLLTKAMGGSEPVKTPGVCGVWSFHGSRRRGVASSPTLPWPQGWNAGSEVSIPWGRAEGRWWVLSLGQPQGL